MRTAYTTCYEWAEVTAFHIALVFRAYVSANLLQQLINLVRECGTHTIAMAYIALCNSMARKNSRTLTCNTHRLSIILALARLSPIKAKCRRTCCFITQRYCKTGMQSLVRYGADFTFLSTVAT